LFADHSIGNRTARPATERTADDRTGPPVLSRRLLHRR
jgi:hypothetical protein